MLSGFTSLGVHCNMLLTLLHIRPTAVKGIQRVPREMSNFGHLRGDAPYCLLTFFLLKTLILLLIIKTLNTLINGK